MKTTVKSSNPQTSRKSNKKSLAQSSNPNNIFIEFIIEAVKNFEVKRWEHFLKDFKYQTPLNAVTNINYTRLNVLVLLLDMFTNSFTSPYYATFNQISQSGGRLRKGAKSCPIQYFNFVIKHIDTGKNITLETYRKLSEEEKKKYKKSSFLKVYRVFNISFIENLEEVNFKLAQIDENESENEEKTDVTKIDNYTSIKLILDNLINNKGLKLNHLRQKKAFYNLRTDEITLPLEEDFKDEFFYYSTLFHELTHWTGADNRLNRFKEIESFTDSEKKAYAFEELVAELGSLLLCFDFSIIEQFANSIMYLKGWFKYTEEANLNDTLTKAFAYSNKAYSYITL